MECNAKKEKFSDRKASKPRQGAAAVKHERRLQERKKAINTRQRRANFEMWHMHIRGTGKDQVRPVEPNA